MAFYMTKGAKSKALGAALTLGCVEKVGFSFVEKEKSAKFSTFLHNF